jgi:hypothetical protein
LEDSAVYKPLPSFRLSEDPTRSLSIPVTDPGAISATLCADPWRARKLPSLSPWPLEIRYRKAVAHLSIAEMERYALKELAEAEKLQLKNMSPVARNAGTFWKTHSVGKRLSTPHSRRRSGR